MTVKDSGGVEQLVDQLTERGHFKLAYILHVRALQQGGLSQQHDSLKTNSDKGVALP